MIALVVALLGAPVIGVVQSRLRARESANAVTREPATTVVDEQGAASPAPLTPSGGYVVTPSGSFLVDASGYSIATFTIPIRCGARQLVIRDVPVPRRSFEFTGRAIGRAVTVRVDGTVLDREHVRGIAVAEGKACTTGPVAFIARLS